MTRNDLFKKILEKKSYLCIGLDTDLDKIPKHLLDEEDPIFAFNKAIIDATRDLCVAYKPNLAFYEAQGLKGWAALEKTKLGLYATHKSRVASIIALLKAKMGSSSSSKCFGILSKSVSKPMQR